MYILKLKNRLTGAERVLEFESAEARASYNFNIHVERYWMIDKTEGITRDSLDDSEVGNNVKQSRN